jgi:predicted metal-dependent enzyme (double-stranded beta helix superfamily)
MDQENWPDNANVTPFPGHPGANLNGIENTRLHYGLQADTTPLLAELATTMHSTLKRCEAHSLSAAAKASLRGYVCDPALLSVEHKQGAADNYRRHLLYAAEDRSFSILAIVWNPKQRTLVHGHSAWGAAGVYEGNPYCESYRLDEDSRQAIKLRHNMTYRLQPGDIATVEPGIDDAHRIGNDSNSRCITVHIYGRDLLAKPGSINICLEHL